jgi:peroxiredoxin
MRDYPALTRGRHMKLKIESIAPDFAATDSNGRNITLAGLIENGPVILVFLRGFF